ncbi:MAG: glycoside hydrolase family 15 protein [Isosphaeraceae bacterium]
MLDFLESNRDQPDEGIWEVRGKRRHFTHSRMMAWVAFDRAVRVVERLGVEAPLQRWRSLRDEIHAQVCCEGYDAEIGAFVQFYGSRRLDASPARPDAVGMKVTRTPFTDMLIIPATLPLPISA